MHAPLRPLNAGVEEIADPACHLMPHIAVRVYGMKSGWSLDTWHSEEKRREVARDLDRRLERETGTWLMVPDPRDFNARIIVALASSHYRDNPTLHSKADGVEMVPGESVAMVTGDCQTIVVYDALNHRLFVLHAGRDSLHPYAYDADDDRGFRLRRDHHYASVVDTLMRLLQKQERFKPEAVGVRTYCGIGPEHFVHRQDAPKAKFYEQIVTHFLQTAGPEAVPGPQEEGRLDLCAIIRAQFRKYGVTNVAHDGIDTYTDMRFASVRRGTRERNCVLVTWKC